MDEIGRFSPDSSDAGSETDAISYQTQDNDNDQEWWETESVMKMLDDVSRGQRANLHGFQGSFWGIISLTSMTRYYPYDSAFPRPTSSSSFYSSSVRLGDDVERGPKEAE